MSPRRRSKNIRVENMYERDGYFSWRNPLTREEFGLGRDRASATAQAVEANVHIAGLRKDRPRLIDRLTGEADRSVDAWNVKYRGLLTKRDLAAVTLKHYKSLGNRMVRMLKPATALQRVTALEATRIIEETIAEGHARTAQALRDFMRDSFREARVQGWYVGENPIMDTKMPVSVEVQRARFTWETFSRVYAGIRLDWLLNAVDLALVSAQRREDIAVAQFKDFHDGYWWCEQQSEKGANQHRIQIPLDLRLECFGKSLADVLSQCRRTGVLSKHLVHQTVNRGNSPAGRRIWIDTISKRFAEAVTASGIDWAPKDPPTFHEIRSLAERLYAAQGGINTQELLGHNDAETTGIYHDPRGAEWVRIKVTP